MGYFLSFVQTYFVGFCSVPICPLFFYGHVRVGCVGLQAVLITSRFVGVVRYWGLCMLVEWNMRESLYYYFV